MTVIIFFKNLINIEGKETNVERLEYISQIDDNGSRLKCFTHDWDNIPVIRNKEEVSHYQVI